MSRLGSVRRASNDLEWRAAMGLQIGTQTPSEKTLRDFEKFMQEIRVDMGLSRYMLIHEHIVRLCQEAEVVDPSNSEWSADSTPMWCYGAIIDTTRLLGDGIHKLARWWAQASGTSMKELGKRWEVPHLESKSTKGAFEIDWKDKEARASAINILATGCLRAIKEIRQELQNMKTHRKKKILNLCRHLLKVVQDDLEVDKEGNLVVATRVAKDRMISITDPEARHSRKAKNKPFNGFKIHAIGDIVSGLISSVAVTSSNVHDGSVANRLLTRAKKLYAEIESLLGDTHYGSAKNRYEALKIHEVNILAPPVSEPASKEGKLGRKDIQIDFENNTAMCAAGIMTNNFRWSWSKPNECNVMVYSWPKETCRNCHLRGQCNNGLTSGHRLRLHPYEQELRKAREDWQKKETRTRYRLRNQCERLMNRVIRHGGRQARAWGLHSANLQAHVIVMTCNLMLLAKKVACS